MRCIISQHPAMGILSDALLYGYDYASHRTQ